MEKFIFYRAASPPPKPVSRPRQDGELSNLLQGEIARLQPRFCVKLDPLHHRGSTCTKLVCSIGEEHL